MSVKVKAPASVITNNEHVNFDDWLKLLQDIKRVDTKEDVKKVQGWISLFRKDQVPDDFKLNLADAKITELADKTTDTAIIDPSKHKSKLISLNDEVRNITVKFEQEAAEIVSTSKDINKIVEQGELDNNRLNVLKKALGRVSTLNNRHNSLMNVPVITNIALTRVAKAVKRS